MKRLWIWGFICFLLPVLAQAAEQPDQLLRAMVDEVLVALKQDKSSKQEKKRTLEVVDAKVLPLFDFTLMTRRALGPAWKTATPEQRQALTQEFRTLLVRAFIAKAFADQGDRIVKFEPFRMAPEEDQVTVKTLITHPVEAPVAVDYDMKKTASGWKVVDVAIAGSRLALDIYNQQFKEPLQRGGPDALLQFLQQKNQAASGKAAQ